MALLLLGIFSQFGLSPAFASVPLPTGGQVVAGSASITTTGNYMNIVNSNGTIINWNDFSIGGGNTVNFAQANAASAVLNRVVGPNLSAIYGTLTSNGHVFLINHNGIMIGSTGIINTAGFTASTLNISDHEFTTGSGTQHFMGHSDALVQNLGTITASDGNVFLIGQHVENDGTLNAAKGTVGLYASDKVYLSTGQADAGAVRLSSPGAIASATGVLNTGTINAVKAELKATGNMYALAINNTGTIRATGTQVQNGVVRFVAIGGTIQQAGTLVAKNADGSGGIVKVQAGTGGTVIDSGNIDVSSQTAGKKGGTIELTGDDVAVDSSLRVIIAEDFNGHYSATLGTVGIIGGGTLSPTVLDASGPAGGGTILVGGDAHGANPNVHNALATYVGPNALLKADATDNGNGGKVVVWSNNATRFYGGISAKGGPNGGNGGWVETSGGYLDAQGVVNTLAVKGNKGSWLLDPYNLTIIDNPGGTPDTFSNSSAAVFDTPIGASILHNDTLLLSLYNTDVTVEASGTITWSGTFDMTTEGASTNLLTMLAGQSITLNGTNIILAGNSISMEAGSTAAASLVAAGGTVGATGSGAVTITNSSITTTAGNVAITGNGGATDPAGINIVSGSTISTGSGNIVLTGTGGTSAGGAINIGDAHSINTLSTSGGNVTLTGNGSSGAPDIALRGAASINLESGGALTLNANGTHQIAIQETTLDGTTYNTPQIFVGSGALVSLVADTIKYSSFNATSNLVVGTSLVSGSDVFFGDTSSTIKIAPYTQSRAIYFGDTDPGTSALWANGHSSSFGTLIAGRADGTGQVTIGAGDNEINQNVAIFGGNIEIDAPVTIDDGYTVYLQANGSDGTNGRITQGSSSDTISQDSGIEGSASLGLWVGSAGTINLTMGSSFDNLAVQGGSGGVNITLADGGSSSTIAGSVSLNVFGLPDVNFDPATGLDIQADGNGEFTGISVANGGSLTLTASNGLTVAAAIALTDAGANKGNVNIDAGNGDFTLQSQINVGAGNVTIAAGGHIFLDTSYGGYITGSGGALTFKTSESASNKDFTLTTANTVNDGSTPSGTYIIDNDGGIVEEVEGSAFSDMQAVGGFASISFAAASGGDVYVAGNHEVNSESPPLTIGLQGRDIYLEGDFDLSTEGGSALIAVATRDLHFDSTVTAFGYGVRGAVSGPSAFVASVGGHVLNSGSGQMVTVDTSGDPQPSGVYALYLANNDGGNNLSAFSDAATATGTLVGASSVTLPTVNTIYYPTPKSALQTILNDPGATVATLQDDIKKHVDPTKSTGGTTGDTTTSSTAAPGDTSSGTGTSKKSAILPTSTAPTDTGGSKTETVVGSGAAGGIGAGGFSVNIPLPPALGNALTPAVRNQLSDALR